VRMLATTGRRLHNATERLGLEKGGLIARSPAGRILTSAVNYRAVISNQPARPPIISLSTGVLTLKALISGRESVGSSGL